MNGKIISDFSLNLEKNIISLEFYNMYYELQLIAPKEYNTINIFDINPNSTLHNKIIAYITHSAIFFKDDTQLLLKINSNSKIGDGWV